MRSNSTARARRAARASDAHLAAGLDLAAERAQQRGHRVGDGLRAADRRPASRRRARAVISISPKPAVARLVERLASSARRCRRAARARAAPREARARQACGRAQPRAREPRRGSGWRGERSGPSRSSTSDSQSPTSGSHQLRDRRPRRRRARRRSRSTERCSATAVPSSSGCASGISGCTSSSPCSASGSDAQERRGERERVDRRADVVPEAGQRQLRRARAAADRRGRLEHAHRAARPGERDRGGQAVRARADDDRVQLTYAPYSRAWPFSLSYSSCPITPESSSRLLCSIWAAALRLGSVGRS